MRKIIFLCLLIMLMLTSVVFADDIVGRDRDPETGEYFYLDMQGNKIDYDPGENLPVVDAPVLHSVQMKTYYLQPNVVTSSSDYYTYHFSFTKEMDMEDLYYHVIMKEASYKILNQDYQVIREGTYQAPEGFMPVEATDTYIIWGDIPEEAYGPHVAYQLTDYNMKPLIEAPQGMDNETPRFAFKVLNDRFVKVNLNFHSDYGVRNGGQSFYDVVKNTYVFMLDYNTGVTRISKNEFLVTQSYMSPVYWIVTYDLETDSSVEAASGKVLDDGGKTLIYDWPYGSEVGFYEVRNEADNSRKYGLIDKNWTIVVDAKYDRLSKLNYRNKKMDQYLIAKNGDLSGVIDQSGTVVLPIEYSYVRMYGDVCYLMKGEEQSVLGEDLKPLAEDKMIKELRTCENGYKVLRRYDNMYQSVVDPNGNTVIPFGDYAFNNGPSKETLIKSYMTDEAQRWGLVNMQGEFIGEVKDYGHIYLIGPGYIGAANGSDLYIINEFGETLYGPLDVGVRYMMKN